MEKEIEMYKNDGFKGFIPGKTLRSNASSVPSEPGVYIVVRDSECAPTFLATGTGGHFKGKNPNVDISELQDNYVDDSKVVYIGKANNLSKRIGQLLCFGAGEAVGHWGGRYLWQLSDAEDLLIAWKETPGKEPRQVEKSMIEDFCARHGKLPFANRKR